MRKTESKERLSLSGYMLAVKYFMQGDTWEFAKEYAAALTRPFERKQKTQI